MKLVLKTLFLLILTTQWQRLGAQEPVVEAPVADLPESPWTCYIYSGAWECPEPDEDDIFDGCADGGCEANGADCTIILADGFSSQAWVREVFNNAVPGNEFRNGFKMAVGTEIVFCSETYLCHPDCELIDGVPVCTAALTIPIPSGVDYNLDPDDPCDF